MRVSAGPLLAEKLHRVSPKVVVETWKKGELIELHS
jgi:hypothetical protein